MKTVKATKTQVLQRHIEDFDRVIDYMSALKIYAKQLIWEDQHSQDQQYCGDGANDPENIVMARKNHKTYKHKKMSERLLSLVVLPAEHEQTSKNGFISVKPFAEDLKEFLEHISEMEFPEEMFPQNDAYDFEDEMCDDDCENCECENGIEEQLKGLHGLVLRIDLEDRDDIMKALKAVFGE